MSMDRLWSQSGEKSLSDVEQDRHSSNYEGDIQEPPSQATGDERLMTGNEEIDAYLDIFEIDDVINSHVESQQNILRIIEEAYSLQTESNCNSSAMNSSNETSGFHLNTDNSFIFLPPENPHGEGTSNCHKEFPPHISENREADEDYQSSLSYVSGTRSGSSENSELRVSVDKAESVASTSGINTKAQKHIRGGVYICTKCGKSFSYKRSLRRHDRIHTGEKRFSCDYCEKRFSRKSYLVRHEWIHTGEKPFPCETCGKQFVDKSALARHLRTHTGEKPYSCDQCGKKFAHKSNLTVHRQTHTLNKPYSCEKCDKKFNMKGNLIKHRRTHEKDRSYKCDFCEKTFCNNGNLQRHIKKVHDQK